MSMFKLRSKFKPTGDQPKAIEKLVKNLKAGVKDQVLLGVTGSGKTFSIANVIEKTQKPCLIISHNKTLAAQLYQEFKEFFPHNAVHYFVSYYDYYQPEAYIPQTDTYIEKDAKINELIDGLRHAAIQSVLSRKDTLVAASVSCIYGVGDPSEYEKTRLELKIGQSISPADIARHLNFLQYERTTQTPIQGQFKILKDQLTINLVTGETVILEFKSRKILNIVNISNFQHPTSDSISIYPAKFWVTPHHKLRIALQNIKNEMEE